jgi:hypothetical protein
MKKFTCIFLFLCLALTVFASCLKNEPATTLPKTEITTGAIYLPGGTTSPIRPLPTYADGSLVEGQLRFQYEYFEKIAEAADFINKADPSIKDGMYKSCIEGIRKNGYIVEPFYKDASVLELPRKIYTQTPIIEQEAMYAGYGFMYYYETYDEDVLKAGGLIFVDYLNDNEVCEDIQYFRGGKRGDGITEEEFANGQYSWNEVEIGGVKYRALSGKFPDNDWDVIWLLYDNRYIIEIVVADDISQITALDVAKDISFKKHALSDFE